MNKEKFIKMLEQAKEDEYGRLYVIGEYNNKIYFGTITTICEDIFKDNGSAEVYDRHFWNDDTLECYVVSTKHDEDIEYKEPKRIDYCKGYEYFNSIDDYIEHLRIKIDDLIKISNKYARLLEKVESDSNDRFY